MQVWDILERTPTIEAMSGLGTVGPLPCRVIYIHPEGRFYTVEFTSRITARRSKSRATATRGRGFSARPGEVRDYEDDRNYE